MKNLLFDKKTGEFNWALLAVVFLAGIFFYNVFTANVNIPDSSNQADKEVVQVQSDEVTAGNY